MAEPRFKATTNVVVGGKAVKAGDSFAASPAQVADALARGLVVPAPTKDTKR